MFAQHKFRELAQSNLSTEVGLIKELVSQQIQKILSHDIFEIVSGLSEKLIKTTMLKVQGLTLVYNSIRAYFTSKSK